MITRSPSKKLKAEKDSKALATSNEGNKDVVPLDLVIEIFRRLPSKSVVRFLLLSKLWRKTILSRHFRTCFPFRSSSEPRLLVVFIDLDRKRKRQVWYFFSPSSSSTSSLSRVTCPFPNPETIEYHRLGYGLTKTIITNPSIVKSKISPRLEASCVVARSFFGYEPVNHQYKVLVLCMKGKNLRPVNFFLRRENQIIEEVSCQHQVLTLGAETESWKTIKYKIPHKPLSNSVCIDGVLYYIAATIGSDLLQLGLMRFDLRSEELDLFTSLSADIKSRFVNEFSTLISYKGKVAFSNKTLKYTYEVCMGYGSACQRTWMVEDKFQYRTLEEFIEVGLFTHQRHYSYG